MSRGLHKLLISQLLLIFTMLAYLIVVATHERETIERMLSSSVINGQTTECHRSANILPLNLFTMKTAKKCEFHVEKNITRIYQSFEHDLQTVSVPTYINKDVPTGSVIYVVGGPAGTVFFQQELDVDPVVKILIRQYRFVYKIGYSGTAFRISVESDGQLNVTDSEIVALAKIVAIKTGRAPDLVGVSMGAPIAASAYLSAQSQKLDVIADLKLLSPLLCSPSGVVKFFDQSLDSVPDRNVQKRGVVVIDSKTGRALRNESFDSRFLIRKFFGPSNEKMDLAHYLDKLPVKPKIVMGSLDKKIYCGDEAYLKAFTAKYPTTIIPGMDHVPTTWDQLSQVMKAIE